MGGKVYTQLLFVLSYFCLRVEDEERAFSIDFRDSEENRGQFIFSKEIYHFVSDLRRITDDLIYILTQNLLASLLVVFKFKQGPNEINRFISNICISFILNFHQVLIGLGNIISIVSFT
jgi:hypothetical protein